MQIFKNKWFARFAGKEDIDDRTLRKAIDAAERGIIDADLGGGVIKQRVAREGSGKSGGYRTIILYRNSDRAFFVYGFAKNAQPNISAKELKDLKKLAKSMLNMTSQEIEDQLVAGNLQKVKCNED